jgi:choline kinase
VQPFADRLFCNAQWESTGIFASLSCAQAWLEAKPCLVSYSDIFYGRDLVRRLMQADAPIAISYDPDAVALWRSRSDNPLRDLETFDISANGYIHEIGARPKSLSEIKGQYMGLLRLTPRGWHALVKARNALPDERQPGIDMTSVLSLVIAAGLPVYGVPTNEPWGEVDTLADLDLYERMYPDV